MAASSASSQRVSSSLIACPPSTAVTQSGADWHGFPKSRCRRNRACGGITDQGFSAVASLSFTSSARCTLTASSESPAGSRAATSAGSHRLRARSRGMQQAPLRRAQPCKARAIRRMPLMSLVSRLQKTGGIDATGANQAKSFKGATTAPSRAAAIHPRSTKAAAIRRQSLAARKEIHSWVMSCVRVEGLECYYCNSGADCACPSVFKPSCALSN